MKTIKQNTEKKLTKAAIGRYIHDPNHCPFCDSESITTNESVQVDGRTGTQGIGCEKCGKSWTDIFILTSITEDK